MFCFGIGAYSTYQKITFVHRIAQYKRMPTMDRSLLLLIYVYA